MSKTRQLFVSMVVLVFAAASVGCSQRTLSVPVASAPAASVPATATAGAGLPNFVAIVKKYGPAVVNVVAYYHHASEMPSNHPGGGPSQPPPQFPNIFRFFGMPFGPEFQQPEGGRAESIGSGFIISSNGYILTNRHVVAHANSVRVTLPNHHIYTARIVGVDKVYDIAVLKIKAHDLPTVAIGNSNDLQAGQWVVAIGSPMGLTHSVSAGIVSYVGRTLGQDQPEVPFIQTDVPINRGNSGGPLFNLRGQVVGINSQIFTTSGGAMGLSFSIPINIAMDAAHQLETKGYVSRGMIGVTIQSVTPRLAKADHLATETGALIAQVKPGSGAAKAGLKPGDVITSFDGTKIYDSSQLPPIVALTKPGTEATVGILRDGKAQTVKVKVMEMPRNGLTLASIHGSSENALLGLTVQNLTPAMRQQLDAPSHGGVAITGVRGVAAMAGLQPGDVILRVGNQPVNNVREFQQAMAKVQPGDSVLLLVSRQGQNMFLAVTTSSQ